MLTLICASCQTPFAISQADYDGRNQGRKVQEWFCSKPCWGRWAGMHYTRSPRYSFAKTLVAAVDRFLGDLSTTSDGERVLRERSAEELGALVNQYRKEKL